MEFWGWCNAFHSRLWIRMKFVIREGQANSAASLFGILVPREGAARLLVLVFLSPAPPISMLLTADFKFQKDNVFEIEEIIIEMGAGGVNLPKKLRGFIHLRAALSYFLDRGWKRHLHPARFWKTNSASPPVVERYLFVFDVLHIIL